MSKSDFNPTRIIDDDNRLLFGKHKGKTIKELTETDYNYLCWIRNQPWGRANEAFMKQIEHFPTVDLTWGKHKGKSLSWVYLNDPNYLDYLRESSYLKTNPQFKPLLDKLRMFH